MFLPQLIMRRLYPLFIACALLSWPAYSQQDNSSGQGQDEGTVEGRIVSSSHPHSWSSLMTTTSTCTRGPQHDGGALSPSGREYAWAPIRATK